LKAIRQELAQRREQLVAQADAQRIELSRFYERFAGPAQAAQTVLGFVGSLRRSPWFIIGLTALLIRTPWRKLARFPKWAWRGWKMLRFAQSWVS
jgi:hypothetical protein